MILTVERVDEKLRAAAKPVLRKMDGIRLDKDDVFVLAAGFEDRVLGALKRISSLGQTGFNAIVIEYLPYIEENKLNEITDLLKQLDCRIHRITYDRREPSGIGNTLLDILGDHKGKILIDISAMSRLLIVQLLVELGKSRLFPGTSIPIRNILLLYCRMGAFTAIFLLTIHIL